MSRGGAKAHAPLSAYYFILTPGEFYMSKDYNASLNLPKTDFPMRAGLPKREPDMLKKW